MTSALYGERHSTPFAYEVVISAAGYDTLLVTELSDRLKPRLGANPVWTGRSMVHGDDTSHPLANDAARVVLVLHQRLWSHDTATRADADLLRERMSRQRPSVWVVAVDSSPLPSWLATAPTCSLVEIGVDGVVEFALAAIAASGGSTQAAPVPAASIAPGDDNRFDRPAPFLSQQRAFSSLRHELDALASELMAQDGSVAAPADEPMPELHSMPNRLVVRLGSIGLSFSWIGGGLGTVAEGRLLVIEWSGMRPSTRGVTPLKEATLVRERVYRPEAAGPDGWRWRADDPNGCAYSTADLAGEWLGGASLAART
ncbi:MAG: hypothetical protein ACREPM_20680 [Gemmatimonadaceae bacterium]